MTLLSTNLLAQSFFGELGLVVLGIALLLGVGLVVLIVRCWHKVAQGSALVKNGMGGTKVSFSGMVVIPILHKVELMDISVKRIEIARSGEDGLICKDNIRADMLCSSLNSPKR